MPNSAKKSPRGRHSGRGRGRGGGGGRGKPSTPASPKQSLSASGTVTTDRKRKQDVNTGNVKQGRTEHMYNTKPLTRAPTPNNGDSPGGFENEPLPSKKLLQDETPLDQTMAFPKKADQEDSDSANSSSDSSYSEENDGIDSDESLPDAVDTAAFEQEIQALDDENAEATVRGQEEENDQHQRSRDIQRNDAEASDRANADVHDSNETEGDGNVVVDTVPGVRYVRDRAKLGYTSLLDSEIVHRGEEESVTTQVHATPARKLARAYISLDVLSDPKSTFPKKFAKAANLFLNCLLTACEDARIVLWKSVDPLHQSTTDGAISKMEPNIQLFKKYFWTADGGISTNDSNKYLRVNLLIPSDRDLSEIFEYMEDRSNVLWWNHPRSYAKPLSCQAVDPVDVGWFLRSSENMILTSDFTLVLRDLTGDQSLGLTWDVIEMRRSQGLINSQNRSVRQKRNRAFWNKAVYAILIECEASKRRKVAGELNRRYNEEKLYPLDISMYYVHGINMPEMKLTERQNGYKKCMLHQKYFLSMIDCEQVQVEKLDYFLAGNYSDKTLREFLATLQVKTIQECKGDRVFTSVNSCFLHGEPHVSLTYYKLLNDEAVHIAQYLPLFMRDELAQTPHDYLESTWVYENTQGKKWDADHRRPLRLDGSPFTFMNFGDDDRDPMSDVDEDGNVIEKTDEEVNRLQKIEKIKAVIYGRSQQQCEETVLATPDNYLERAEQFLNMEGRQLGLNQDGQSVDNRSITSDLTEGGSDVSTGTTQSTRDAAVAHATNKMKSKHDQDMAVKDREIERANEEINGLKEIVAQIQAQMSISSGPSRPTPIPATPGHLQQHTDPLAPQPQQPGPGSDRAGVK